MLRLTDLREILRYVPRFRDRVFVIAIDGAIVEDDNFPNILLDTALLRSLNIRVALVHGAAHQVKRYAELVKVTPLSAKDIQISAKKAGVTQVNLWDEDGQIHSIDVLIYGDARELVIARGVRVEHGQKT